MERSPLSGLLSTVNQASSLRLLSHTFKNEEEVAMRRDTNKGRLVDDKTNTRTGRLSRGVCVCVYAGRGEGELMRNCVRWFLCVEGCTRLE